MVNIVYFLICIGISVLLYLSYRYGAKGKKPIDNYLYLAGVCFWFRLLIRLFDFEETKSLKTECEWQNQIYYNMNYANAIFLIMMFFSVVDVKRSILCFIMIMFE